VKRASPPDTSICVIDDDQVNPDKLEKCNIKKKSGILAYTSMKTIQKRLNKIRSLASGQPVMIHAVIISSFKNVIFKIREIIGEESEALIGIHELLSKYIQYEFQIFLKLLIEMFSILLEAISLAKGQMFH
jgi:hypothetical protein